MQTNSKMTPRQEQIYSYILKYTEKHGYEPSTNHIANHFKVRVQSIQQVFYKLSEIGLIKPKKHEPRGDYIVIHR